MTLADGLAHVLASQADKDMFALDLHCHPNTNTEGLGPTSRRIVEYLATNSGGFGGKSWTPDTGEYVWHGLPGGITTRALADAVYGTAPATAGQLRTVQRAVRDLEKRGLVQCWTGWPGFRSTKRCTPRGFDADMPVRHCSSRSRGSALI